MKYRLTDETKEWSGHKLRKIEYTEEWLAEHGLDELEGGWIESEKNLAQEGDAHVYGNAYVYGNACVSGNACVYGDAHVYGNADVYGNAYVYGDACVSGDACVYGDAHVYGDANVYGNAYVYGDACVSQGIITSMRISTTEQWHEYQYRKAELQKKWDKESKDED
jgi:uncharacterized Fe-S cluster protein YjdI